jgi:hypothetical protein
VKASKHVGCHARLPRSSFRSFQYQLALLSLNVKFECCGLPWFLMLMLLSLPSSTLRVTPDSMLQLLAVALFWSLLSRLSHQHFKRQRRLPVTSPRPLRAVASRSLSMLRRALRLHVTELQTLPLLLRMLPSLQQQPPSMLLQQVSTYILHPVYHSQTTTATSQQC